MTFVKRIKHQETHNTGLNRVTKITGNLFSRAIPRGETWSERVSGTVLKMLLFLLRTSIYPKPVYVPAAVISLRFANLSG